MVDCGGSSDLPVIRGLCDSLYDAAASLQKVVFVDPSRLCTRVVRVRLSSIFDARALVCVSQAELEGVVPEACVVMAAAANEGVEERAIQVFVDRPPCIVLATLRDQALVLAPVSGSQRQPQTTSSCTVQVTKQDLWADVQGALVDVVDFARVLHISQRPTQDEQVLLEIQTLHECYALIVDASLAEVSARFAERLVFDAHIPSGRRRQDFCSGTPLRASVLFATNDDSYYGLYVRAGQQRKGSRSVSCDPDGLE